MTGLVRYCFCGKVKRKLNQCQLCNYDMNLWTLKPSDVLHKSIEQQAALVPEGSHTWDRLFRAQHTTRNMQESTLYYYQYQHSPSKKVNNRCLHLLCLFPLDSPLLLLHETNPRLSATNHAPLFSLPNPPILL